MGVENERSIENELLHRCRYNRYIGRYRCGQSRRLFFKSLVSIFFSFGGMRYQSWCKGGKVFYDTFFLLFFSFPRTNSSHFLSRCLSHFFSLGRRRRGKDRGPSEVSLARKSRFEKCAPSLRSWSSRCVETKKRVVFFFFEERERGKIIDFHSADSLRENWIQMADDAPTPTQQKPTQTGGGETAPSQTPQTQHNQVNPLPVVAQEPEVDRSVHPSGIVPVLQCVYEYPCTDDEIGIAVARICV